MADVEPNVEEEEEMISVAEEDEEEEEEEDTFPVESLRKMKVAELRKLLKERGLPSLGSKAELLSRLQKALSPDADTGEEAEIIEDDAEDEDVEEDDTSDADNAITEEEEGPKAEEEEVPVPEKTAPVVEKPASPANAENSAEPKEKKEGEEEAAAVLTDVVTEPAEVTEKAIPAVTGPESETPSAEATDKADAASAKPTATSDEKLRQRAERFGIASETDKKAARAARFGGGATNLSNKPSAKIAPTPVTADDIDRLKKRAERFGTVVSSTLSKLEDEDKLRKRKQRFGQITAPTSNPTTQPTTPAVKINKEEVEEKKRKRAERFGLS